ncbi:MAG: nucleoside-diphosphate sugar epimerase [Leeuwenhoekiella sp.]|nr:MAG: nucleoside-diphosphate sugar epimerase [Leeuwenhoekiella sp.]
MNKSSKRKRVLVTGATGFIGSRLLEHLLEIDKYLITCSLRGERNLSAECGKYFTEVRKGSDWSRAIQKGQIIIHLAARAHVVKEYSKDPLSEFRKVNVEGTLELARQAAAGGAKRFVFLSSIGVNGNSPSGPFTESDEAVPENDYAQSKLEAEIGLWGIQRETGMEVVIIRPPLVYGHDAPGNFKTMVKWIRQGIPLPLGSIENRRSLIALDNLVDFIHTCMEHPAAANQLFLVSDSEVISTTELLRDVGVAMGRPARLVPIPVALLKIAAKVVGKQRVAEQLLGSLEIDNSKALKKLSWQPPLTTQNGLKACFTRRKSLDSNV